MSHTIYVRCTLVVPVEVPDNDPENVTSFIIEENSCPGTGCVGAAIDATIRECDEVGVCWACKLFGENKILTDAESEPFRR